MYEYRVIDAKVVDGDTVDLTIDVGFRHTLTDRFRLYGPDPNSPQGLNAPELNTPEGQAAKQFLAGLLTDFVGGKDGLLMARTIRDRREKFGRWLVVLFTIGGTNLNARLIEVGHAATRKY